MMLRRWAVREHFVSRAYLKVLVRLCLLGWAYMNFDLLLVQNYDLFRRFDAHFFFGADLEKYWADYSHIAHICSLRSLVVPFWTLTLKLTQHFDLIYNIGKSD